MARRGMLGIASALLFLTGCLHPVGEKVDRGVCELAAKPRDLQPVSHGEIPKTLPSPSASELRVDASEPILQTSGEKEKDTPRKRRLNIPNDLIPGGPVPPIRLPRPTPENEAARKQALEQLYPPLPALGEDNPFPPGPEGRPFTLSDLQSLAISNSPHIKQAKARVEEARGAAIQAGLPPNPMVGFESDTSGTTGGAGYTGTFLEQRIVTSNKLQLARAVASIELKNAELALYNAQAELATKVRQGYFGVLVAEEAMRLNRGLVKFTTEVYKEHVDLVQQGGFAAPHEPMYLRALVITARGKLVEARNRRTSAWKQLAANMGVPGLPPTQLAGRLDVPIPVFTHREVLAKALSQHTQIRTAQNARVQAQYQLEQALKTPIPDVNLRVMVQKDRTSPPFQASPSVAVSVPVPIFDKNQGNILSAQAMLIRQDEEEHRVRSELAATLADAFERYENGRTMLDYYRTEILPAYVRVYRGVYERYHIDSGSGTGGLATATPAVTDVVVAQQTLAQAIGAYIDTLGRMWQSVVDVAAPLQTLDLFGIEGPRCPVTEIIDLEKMCSLPCCHPCSPLPGVHKRVWDGDWPNADARGFELELLPELPKPKEPEKKEKKEEKDTPKNDVLLPPLLPTPQVHTDVQPGGAEPDFRIKGKKKEEATIANLERR